ncbi:MAG: mercury(II) reductase, partial [Spirochaetes bacterium]|nr:mercury(II) reductase [Spirochaetota bacterium]
EAGYKYKVTKLPLDQVPIALASRDTRGFIKLIADTASNTIIGAHIVAPEAGNMIQTAVMAIQFGLKPDDISKTFFPYLTDVEGVKLAVLSFNREISKLSCCAV